jgi:hypothetical protein
MSCSYTVGDVTFALEHAAEVRRRLQDAVLEPNTFQVIESDDHALLTQADTDMSHSDTDIIDGLLADIARWNAGTEHDGQIVSWEYEGDGGVKVLVAGQCETVESEALVIDTDTPIEPGQVANVTVTVRAIGLPGKRVVIIGQPEK